MTIILRRTKLVLTALQRRTGVSPPHCIENSTSDYRGFV